MGISRAAVILGALASTAGAQSYFTAPPEGLTLRDAPGGTVIGSLAPGAGPLEATAREGAWVRFGSAERDAWASLDALNPAKVPGLAGSHAPDGLLCTGVEPFWSLALHASTRLEELGRPAAPLRLVAATPADGRRDFPARLDFGSVVAVLRPLACSDGMSDRTEAWTVDVLNGARLLTGCCRLSP